MQIIKWITIGSIALLGATGCEDGPGGDAPSQDGASTLTTVGGALTAGDPNLDCKNGGIELKHGIDKDHDGKLSADEVTDTYQLCHGESADKEKQEAQETEIIALKATILELVGKVDTNKDDISKKPSKDELDADYAKKADLEKDYKKKVDIEKEHPTKVTLEDDYKKKVDIEKEHPTKVTLEDDYKKKADIEADHPTKVELVADYKKKADIEADHPTKVELIADYKKKIDIEADHPKKDELDIIATEGLPKVLDDLKDHIDVDTDKGKVVFGKPGKGVNVHIVDGSDDTECKDGDGVASVDACNGKGNLVIGYDELPSDAEVDKDYKTGSHNLVVGSEHDYKGYGGLVAGKKNTTEGPFAVVSGGHGNKAKGKWSVVSGGKDNISDGEFTSISGGKDNWSGGDATSICGGKENMTYGDATSISGGKENIAGSDDPDSDGVTSAASISGGKKNWVKGDATSICGGELNDASGDATSISGGKDNVAKGKGSSISGGKDNVADAEYASVAGGKDNLVTGKYAAIAGGKDKTEDTEGGVKADGASDAPPP
jgi:hypothetical protein